MAFHVGAGVGVVAGIVGVGHGAIVDLPPEQPETASVASTSRIKRVLPCLVFNFTHLILQYAPNAGVARMMPALSTVCLLASGLLIIM
jgi:hypothetical protein